MSHYLARVRQQVTKIALVAIAYFSVGWLTIALLDLGVEASPIWFSAGIALAALLIWGEGIWLGIALGDFSLIFILGASWQLGVSSALGSTLSALLGVKLLRLTNFSPYLMRIRDAIALIVFAAVLSPLLNGAIDLVARLLAGKLAGQDFWYQWWILWLGDNTGILLVTPLLLQLQSQSWQWRSRRQMLEMAMILGLLAGVSWIIFASHGININFPWLRLTNAHYLEYMPLPLVAWAALRFQIWGAVLASWLVSLLAMLGAFKGVGPFVLQTPTLTQAILLLQTYMIIVASTALLLAAAVSERQQLEKQLRLMLERQVEERTLQLQDKIAQVERLDEMKTVFLQAVAHDLRTSMMGLSMILKNLQKQSGDTVSLARSILERIVQNSDRQLTLVNALAQDHFAEERSLILCCQPLSLKEHVETLLPDWQLQYSRNQAQLENLIPDNLPNIYADPEQLKCVFNNLFANCLKHNPPGIHVAIEASLDKDAIRCTITDNGIGMSEQQCQNLFKLYVRSLYNQRLTGIGLGAYQCRQIIEAQGGAIGVNSTPGVGSQFWFTLPVTKI
jgi:signal transduction histidine kinase